MPVITPYFSELNYAYLVTDELGRVNRGFYSVPFFPTQPQERFIPIDVIARLGAGVIYAIQFKRPQAVLDTAGLRPGEVNQNLTAPLFRMKLYTGKTSRQGSNQHHNLRLFEGNHPGLTVRYASPKFHTRGELNRFYFQNALFANSFVERPSGIPDYPLGERNHYVAYDLSGNWASFSEEADAYGKSYPEKLFEDIKKKFNAGETIEIAEEPLYELLTSVRSFVSEKVDPKISEEIKKDQWESLRPHPFINFAPYGVIELPPGYKAVTKLLLEISFLLFNYLDCIPVLAFHNYRIALVER